MYGHFAYLYVCAPWAYVLREGIRFPETGVMGDYGLLVVLGIQLGSSRKAAIVLTTEPRLLGLGF